MIRATLVALLLAGCGGSGATPEPERSIEGTFTLFDENGWTTDTCRGDGGYVDIVRGLRVTLTDQDGSVIGTASLPSGQTVDRNHCQFSYELADVPDAEFYTVTIGNRGELTYSFAEMEAMDWQVASELGS